MVGVKTERYICCWCTVMVLVTGMVKGKRAALLVGSLEIGLEINTEKTKYMFMSTDQHAGKITT